MRQLHCVTHGQPLQEAKQWIRACTQTNLANVHWQVLVLTMYSLPTWVAIDFSFSIFIVIRSVMTGLDSAKAESSDTYVAEHDILSFIVVKKLLRLEPLRLSSNSTCSISPNDASERGISTVDWTHPEGIAERSVLRYYSSTSAQ